MTDLRSESFRLTEFCYRKVYSPQQKEWFFNKLSQAAEFEYVVWVNTCPWTDPVEVGLDRWGGFVSDCDELSSHIAATILGAGPQNLLVLSAASASRPPLSLNIVIVANAVIATVVVAHHNCQHCHHGINRCCPLAFVGEVA
ncbi:hypothetical protein ACHAW5_000623 [Stephanodiscus triporus]|uniref:Uncharacterized protein n=1 Tax=Stephanodiscus triporus TaxID=2934178 RepID=A0ABD3PW30_9STRA